MAIETFVLNKATSGGDNGQSFRRNYSGSSVITLSVTGEGAVSASASVYASADGFNWQLLRSITTSGAGSATTSFDNDESWPYFKADVTAISGTGAEAAVGLSSSDCVGGVGKASTSSSNVNLPLQGETFDIFDLMPISVRRKLVLSNPYSAIADDVVHPSVLYFPDGWNGYKYWMAYTPYPNSNSDYENPSITVSNDKINWNVPSGVVNPLVEKPLNGYNADTHLFMSPDNSKMYLAYRERILGAKNSIKVMQTIDGSSWSSPTVIIQGDVGTQDYASPSIFWNPVQSKWQMISHNLDGGAAFPMNLTSSTTADLFGAWSVPTAITMPNPTAGRTFWHSSFARMVDGKIVGLIQDVVNGGTGNAGALFAAESVDGGLTFATKQIYGDLGFYRPSFSFYTTDSGAIGITGWIGRLVAGKFTIESEEFSVGKTNYDINEALGYAATLGRQKPNILWLDSFNRADGALGSPQVGSAFTIDTGTYTVAGNAISSGSAGNNRAFVSVGNADHVVETVNTVAASPSAYWLCFRVLNTTNYWRIGGESTGSTALKLQNISGGSVVSNITVQGPTSASTINQGDTIRVVCRGKRFRVYINGRFWSEVIDDSGRHLTGVSVGLQSTNAGNRFDYFFVAA